MFINENLKETAFNYCAQWSVVDDRKIDFYIISMGVMSHTTWRLLLEGAASTKRNENSVVKTNNIHDTKNEVFH